MERSDSDALIRADDRAVAPVIGFILLFGILVIAFSGYQATAVPQQNAETEFQHYEDVQNDMTVVRNSISQAGQTNVSQFESIRIGTNYRKRILALNPPDPRGTLRTTDAYNIKIDGSGGSPQEIPTQFLEYRNDYNELDIGSIYYENSVVYLDERGEGGGLAVLDDQNLVPDGGGSARVTALQGEYEESSVGRVTVELYPAEAANLNLDDFDGQVTVDIPTRLTGEEYWDEELDGFDGYMGVELDVYATGVHQLTLEVDIDDLRFNTVGIDSVPEGDSSARQGVGPSPPSSTPSSGPAFDSLNIEVSKSSGGTDNIQQVRATGSVNDPDPDGEIQLQLFDNGTPFGENEVDMTSGFSVMTDPNSSNKQELSVTIRLLDGDGIEYQSCQSNDQVAVNNNLDLSDFDCN